MTQREKNKQTQNKDVDTLQVVMWVEIAIVSFFFCSIFWFLPFLCIYQQYQNPKAQAELWLPGWLLAAEYRILSKEIPHEKNLIQRPRALVTQWIKVLLK